ncbi:MAG: DNA-binding response regulator [Dictyoglomus sp. NZ13-RE01]|nr:MAG: DNA-binding response regulator [Dictyoglomus sp. NZ13-RE01]
MRILIVEDEKKLALAIKKGLEREGFAVDCAFDGEEAQYFIETGSEDYDLVILDIMLPKKDGIAICKEVRKKGITTPILMLTAKDKIEDKVLGLDSGADDYLVKPFAFDELLARIRALLRRPKQLVPEILKVGDLTLDTSSRRVFKGDKEIFLTSKEFAILEYLMRNVNKIVSREQILAHVWDYDSESFSNVVDVHIKNLRKKIDTENGNKILQTIRGMGYRLKG